MSASVNKVILVGNLGSDPEIRNMQSSDRVASFSVATSESWKDKATGERKERTQWHKVVIFNQPLVDISEKYLQKGSKIFLEGSLETRKWQDKDGRDQYTTEVVLRPFNGQIVMLSSSDRTDGQGQPTSRQSSGRNSRLDDMEDDIPY